MLSPKPLKKIPLKTVTNKFSKNKKNHGRKSVDLSMKTYASAFNELEKP
jgi:hypothetical protein